MFCLSLSALAVMLLSSAVLALAYIACMASGHVRIGRLGASFRLLEDAGTCLEGAETCLRKLKRNSMKQSSCLFIHPSQMLWSPTHRGTSHSARAAYQSAQADPHCREAHHSLSRTACVQAHTSKHLASYIHPERGKRRV